MELKSDTADQLILRSVKRFIVNDMKRQTATFCLRKKVEKAWQFFRATRMVVLDSGTVPTFAQKSRGKMAPVSFFVDR